MRDDWEVLVVVVDGESPEWESDCCLVLPSRECDNKRVDRQVTLFNFNNAD